VEGLAYVHACVVIHMYMYMHIHAHKYIVTAFYIFHTRYEKMFLSRNRQHTERCEKFILNFRKPEGETTSDT
jgi:hypothetical protein